MYLLNAELTVNWTLEPKDEPIPLSSLDIVLTEPNGQAVYTNAAIAADKYLAPTLTDFGTLCYTFLPNLVGLWCVALTDGTELAHTIYFEYKLQIDINDIFTKKFIPGSLIEDLP